LGSTTDLADHERSTRAALDSDDELLDNDSDGTATGESLGTIDFDREGNFNSLRPSNPRIETMDFDSTKNSAPPGSDRCDDRNDSTDSNPANQVPVPSLPDHVIGDELGRGGMGVVYHCYDERKKVRRHVALKTLQRISPADLLRFKHEFRRLADLAHVNVVALYDLMGHGDSWCFTMEYLEGVDFLEFVWSGFDAMKADEPPLTKSDEQPGCARLNVRRIKRLKEALKQLAAGLGTLHHAEILHRDVKPSNVMVTTERRLVLLDFGLAADLQPELRGSTTRGIQGTPEYMSPEQAAARETRAASDWYAVGVMLYELLTGFLPFSGSPLGVIQRKQTEDPVDPLELAPDAPPELCRLCTALLDRDPEKRPTAVEVLHALDATDMADVLRKSQRADNRRSVELVGRERHLEALKQGFERIQAGESLSIFVHGQSGMGKSVLIQRFLQEVRRTDGAVVLEGRCYEQESVPFKALDSLVDNLCDYLLRLPKDVYREFLPRDTLALFRVFPVLGQLNVKLDKSLPPITNATQQEVRQRALTALRELLRNLGERHALVLYIDDLQWGDVDSAKMLVDVLRPPDGPKLLLLASYRNEHQESSPCLQAFRSAYERGRHRPQCEELSVESLTEEEATSLAATLLGAVPDSLKHAQQIARESAGWPFFVWELVQHAKEDATGTVMTLGLDDVIWARVNRLSEETQQLLSVIAVSGRPTPASEAYQVIDQVALGRNLLHQLRANHFVRTTDSETDSVVESYHDRIREAVIARLDPATIRHYNLRFAEVIQKSGDVDQTQLEAWLRDAEPYDEPAHLQGLSRDQWLRIFDLSVYFDAAGDANRALPFAVAGAEQAKAQNALEVAELHYRIAVRGSNQSDSPLRFRISEGLGDVLMLRGKYEFAELQLQAALFLANGDLAKARIEGKLGELAFKRGDMRLATDHLERALEVLGRKPPQRPAVIHMQVAWETLVQIMHTIWPSRFVGRRSLAHATTDLAVVHLYARLSYAYWFSRGLVQTLWAHLCQINRAERYPDTLELASAYSLHAPIMSTLPLFRRGISYAKKSYSIRQDKGDLWGQGQSLHFLGVVLFAASRFDECAENCREAIALLDRTGDVWEANMARYHLAEALYHLGDLGEAVAEARRMYQSGNDVGDVQAIAVILVVWGAADFERFPVAELEAELIRKREDPLATLQLIQACGLKALLYEKQPDEASRIFREAIAKANERGIKNTYVMSNYAWLATALRIHGETMEAGSSEQKRLFREAKRAARKSLKMARRFQNDLPHALRENAIMATHAGRESTAKSFFAQSLEVAEKQGARYQRAQTLLAQAEAGITFGWPEAGKQFAEAQLEIQTIQAATSVDESA